MLRHRTTLRSPFPAPATHYVLVEVEGADDEALAEWMSSAGDAGLFGDATIAQSPKQASELWALREGICESRCRRRGCRTRTTWRCRSPRSRRSARELEALFAREYAGWELCLFGHIGDGNLHVNVMKPDALEVAQFRARTAAADRDLFALVQKHAGSISAEHGIGLLKKPYLGYSRSPEELALLRSVKQALDPLGILNPGKIFD